MKYIGKTVMSSPIIGATTFVHNQGGASTTWTVTHNLGRFPSVTIVTDSNVVIIGDITYNSTNQLTISLATADSGKAYLN
jgi:hypothetical protein|tara:strand:- start:221 stop:460 length:240 start_codon:yes stop_codon:yes gene_type:complete